MAAFDDVEALRRLRDLYEDVIQTQPVAGPALDDAFAHDMLGTLPEPQWPEEPPLDMASPNPFEARHNPMMRFAGGGYVETPYEDYGDAFAPDFIGSTPPPTADDPPGGVYAWGGPVERHASKGIVGRSFKGLRDLILNEGGERQARRFDRLGDEAPLDRWSDKALSELFIGDRRNMPLTTINPGIFERGLANEIPLDVRVQSPYSYKDASSDDLAAYLRKLGGYATSGGLNEVPALNISSRFPMTSEGIRYPNVTGHEGRHRMRAMEMLGDTRAPMVLAPWGNPAYVFEALSKNGNRLMGESGLNYEGMAQRDQKNLDWWLQNMSTKLPNEVFAEGGEVGRSPARYDTGSMFLNSSEAWPQEYGSFSPTPEQRRQTRLNRLAQNNERVAEINEQARTDPARYWGEFATNVPRGAASIAQLAGIPGSVLDVFDKKPSWMPTAEGIGDYLDTWVPEPTTHGGRAGRDLGQAMLSMWGVGGAGKLNALGDAFNLGSLIYDGIYPDEEPAHHADGGVVRGYRTGKTVVDTIKAIRNKFGSFQADRAEQAADLTRLDRYTDRALMHMFDPDKKSTGLFAAMDPDSFQDYATRLPPLALEATPYPRWPNVPKRLARGVPEHEQTLDRYLGHLADRIESKGIDSANDYAFMPSLWFGRTQDPLTNVVEHEGRHRTMALGRLGDDKVLVNLMPKNEGELRGDIEDRVAALQKKYFPRGANQLILPQSLGGDWAGGADAMMLGMRRPRRFYVTPFADGGAVEAHKSKGRVGIEFVKNMRDWLEPEKAAALDKINKVTNSTKNEALIYGAVGDKDPLSEIVRGNATGVAVPDWSNRFAASAAGQGQPFFSAHTHPNNTLSPSRDDLEAWGRNPRSPEDMLISSWPSKSILQIGSLGNLSDNPIDRVAMAADIVNNKIALENAPKMMTNLTKFATANGMRMPSNYTSLLPWWADMEAGLMLNHLGNRGVPIHMSEEHLIPGTKDKASDVYPELLKFMRRPSIASDIPFKFQHGGPVGFASRGSVLARFARSLKDVKRHDFEPLVEKLKQPDGGFTWQPVLDEYPTKGFAASIFPERSHGLNLDELGIDPLYDYFRRNEDIFGRPDHYFGGWHDPSTSRLFLDASIVRPNQREIEELSRLHDQKAYFDLENLRSIEVNPFATSGGAVEAHKSKGIVGDAFRAWKNKKAKELAAEVAELNAGKTPDMNFTSPDVSPRLQTVSDPRRVAFPTIYKDPRAQIEDAIAKLQPDPGKEGAMFRLFGHTRDSLDELSQGDRYLDSIEPPEMPWSRSSKARGADISEQVLTPRNASRLQDVLGLALENPLIRPTRSWYEMRPLWDMMDRMGIANQARGLNTRMGVMSPGSNPKTEINRGFFAHYLSPQGRIEDLSQFGALPANRRPDHFPEDMIGLVPHPYMNTAAMPNLRSFEATGRLSSDRHKVPTYVMATDPIWQYGGRPIADAHLTRFVGYPDARTTDRIAGIRKEMTNSEYGDFVPWWRKNIANELDMRDRDAQALLWNVGGPQTGVAYIGPPKLEMIADQIDAASRRLGLPLEETAYRMLSGQSPGFAEGGEVEHHASKGRVGKYAVDFVKDLASQLNPSEQEALRRIGAATKASGNESFIAGVADGTPRRLYDLVEGGPTWVNPPPELEDKAARSALVTGLPWFTAHTHPGASSITPSFGDIASWRRDSKYHNPGVMLIQKSPEDTILRLGVNPKEEFMDLSRTQALMSGIMPWKDGRNAGERAERRGLFREFSRTHGMNAPTEAQEGRHLPWYNDMNLAPELDYLARQGFPVQMSAEHVIPHSGGALVSDVYPELTNFLSRRASNYPFAEGGSVDDDMALYGSQFYAEGGPVDDDMLGYASMFYRTGGAVPGSNC